MKNQSKEKSWVLIAAVYLLGIFMGAIDTGIVTPARTVIQSNLSVTEKTGIWMITIYTLAYAASIPIMGKLADKFGRKYIYLASILLFGTGSLFCGLSQNFGSFTILLIARAVQAIGGGGILPVATAQFGTTFPEDKRGMALGLVGGVYGIANIFGASAGSAILDLFGKNNWQFIFYINVPITLFIVAAGVYSLPNSKEANVKKIDIFGILILTGMVLSLLYGLRNIDFFNFSDTIVSNTVMPFLITFIVLLPIFILVEKKAEDPVMNLTYFTSAPILITLIVAFITGIVMMGMIFVPQFSENALKIQSGSGGYFVIILGVFAGLGAPFSGKLIDKFGAKLILGFGFLISIMGSIFLITVTANYPNTLNVVISLMLMGTGIGFTMGTPVNYMMLENTKKEESNSALATLSLVRSIGTAIAPAIMVGFLAHAGTNVQTNIMKFFPKEVKMAKLPYAEVITDRINKLKQMPQMKEKMANVNIPDLTSMQKVKINMKSGGNAKLPDNILKKLQGSDVTTITKNSKVLSSYMFDRMTPKLVSSIQSGIQSGIDGIQKGYDGINMAMRAMQSGGNNYSTSTYPSNSMAQKMGQMQTKQPASMQGSGMKLNGNPVAAMQKSAAEMKDTISKMQILKNAIPSAFEKAKKEYLDGIDKRKDSIEKEFQKTIDDGFKQVYMTVTISSLIALIILVFYKRRKSVI